MGNLREHVIHMKHISKTVKRVERVYRSDQTELTTVSAVLQHIQTGECGSRNGGKHVSQMAKAIRLTHNTGSKTKAHDNGSNENKANL